MKYNTVIYLRVSNDEQANQGYSLQYQEDTATEYCKLKGYNVCKIFKDNCNAMSFKRPEWEKLTDYIKTNKGLVKKIVFLKWDRFSRNAHETQAVIKELAKQNVDVECIEQPLDLNVPENLLLLNIYLAVPEIENTKISLRTKAGMRQATTNGCWVGKVPLGYDRDWMILGNTQRKNATLKPNNDACIVLDIFNFFTKENLSSETIRIKIKDQYGKNISKQTVLDILKNIVYIGKVRAKATRENSEEILDGLHPALISNETFQDAQDVLNGKKRKHERKDKSEEFPLKEIIKCSLCGLSYTASTTTKKKGLIRYPYYHCSKTKGHDRFSKEIVHNVFDALLEEFEVKSEIKELYKSVLVETINKHNKSIIEEQKSIDKEIEKVRNRIKNTQNNIADSNNGGFEFLGMLKRYTEEENDLIMKHATIIAEAKPKNADIEYLLELFNSFKILYHSSDFKLKKKIVSSVFPKPMKFFKTHFRTEEVNPLFELLILNSNKLQRLKIETSHLKRGSSSSAPPNLQFSNLIAMELVKINELKKVFPIDYIRSLKQKVG